MSQMNEEGSGTWKMVTAMLLSGTIGVFVVESGENVYNVVFFRCLFGALIMGGYAWHRGFLQRVTGRELAIVLTGGAAIVVNWCLLFRSYEFASIGLTTVAYHTQPFFVILLAAILLRERVTSIRLALIPLAFVGVVLIINPFGGDVSAGWLQGMGLALLAALFYALATVVIKLVKGVSSYTIVLLQLLLGTALLAPLVQPGESTLTLGPHWLWLLGLGALHTCVMYVLMYDAFKTLPSIKIAVLAYLYPVAAVALDYAIYGETLTPIQLLGMALIIVSGFLVNNPDALAALSAKLRRPGPIADDAVPMEPDPTPVVTPAAPAAR